MDVSLNKVNDEKSSYGVNRIDDNDWKIIEDKIINNPNLNWEDSRIGEFVENSIIKKSKSSIRRSKISFFDYDEEIDKLFVKIILEYNRLYSGWKYYIDGIEDIQVTRYSEGDFYDWHVDASNWNIVRNGKECNRKISVTVFLNDPEEYEGGEFDLEIYGPKKVVRYKSFKLSKGSIIVFPSDKWHRVRPVTSGVRKSLVIWFSGPPLR